MFVYRPIKKLKKERALAVFRILIAVGALLFTTLASAADRNSMIESFSKAKRLLLSNVYSQLPKKTIYCDADFNSKGQVTNPNGFESDKYIKRQLKIEWEHVVPAENFGRIFSEWRDGHPECVNSKGKAFKGRNCASKVSKEYRLMQSDMYNLYPAIGCSGQAKTDTVSLHNSYSTGDILPLAVCSLSRL